MLPNEPEIVIYVGTHRLIACVANFAKEPHVSQHVIRYHPEGFKNGSVTNLERAAASLESLTDKLISDSALRLPKSYTPSVYVVLGSPKVKAFTFSSSLYFQGYRRTISSHDVCAVIDQTRSVATLPLSEHILQTLPVSFIVNDLEDISDPIGLEAHRLGVKIKIFTITYDDFKNISRAFEAAEIDIKGFYPRALATSYATLTKQEMQDGVLLCDIGAEGTFMTLWKKGELVNTRTIPVGDRSLNEVLSKDLQIDIADAQKVKNRYSSLELNPAFGEELIPLIVRDGNESQHIQRQIFQSKFLDHYKHWFELIISEANQFINHEKIYHPQLVFAGDGVALDGFLEFVKKQFSLESRIGYTHKIDAPHELLVDSSMAPALGLYRWVVEEGQNQAHLLEPRGFIKKTLANAVGWFSEYF